MPSHTLRCWMDGKQFPTSIDQFYLAQRLGSGIWRVSGTTRPDRNVQDCLKWRQRLRSLSDVGREKLWEAMENELEQQQQEEAVRGAVTKKEVELPDAADWDLDLVYSGYPSAVELEKAKLFPLIYGACFMIGLMVLQRIPTIEQIFDQTSPYWLKFLVMWLLLMAFATVPLSMLRMIKAMKTWWEREEKRW